MVQIAIGEERGNKMASTRLKQTKDGKQYYEIRVRMSRGKPELSTRWYIPDGWCNKSIEKELAKQAAEFERKCKAGEVISRADQNGRFRRVQTEDLCHFFQGRFFLASQKQGCVAVAFDGIRIVLINSLELGL